MVDVDDVVVGQGGSAVELVELVGPVPVVGGMVVRSVVLPGKIVVVVGGTTVVVGSAVVVVPVGTVEHPRELARDPSTVPTPANLPKAACSDRSRPQIG